MTEDYSCGFFLLCLRRFINMRGTPSQFQSDPGDQLLAAAVELGKWDFSSIHEWTAGKKTVWKKIPVDSQHFNGSAESMIRVTKLQLTSILKERKLTKGELDTVFSDVAFIINSRPLMARAGSDPLSGGPITPLHLMGGRASVGVPAVRFDGKAGMTRRLQYLEEIKTEFWQKWFAQVFSHLVPCYKWRREFRDVMEGDIVLLKDNNAVKDTYRLARVKRAIPGEDGKVRRVVIEYKNVDGDPATCKAPFRETERSIHNVAVIVPVDWKSEDIETAVTSGMKYKCNF